MPGTVVADTGEVAAESNGSLWRGVAGGGRGQAGLGTAGSQATHGGVARRTRGGLLTVEELTGRQARSEVPIRPRPYASGVRP